MALTDERIARFARQLLVPAFGERAQERLAAARVRAVSLGAAASAGLVYLVQAGVGRLWLEDSEHVGPGDLAGWIFEPASTGEPRVDVARRALAELSRFTTVQRYPIGGVPTAAFVAEPSVAQALASAETARRAGIPHVVIEADADGGSVVSVPVNAPCYACGRSTSGAGRQPAPGIEALSALAAAELVQMIALPGSIPGRRTELLRGVATTRATARVEGCACGLDPRRSGSDTGDAPAAALSRD